MESSELLHRIELLETQQDKQGRRLQELEITNRELRQQRENLTRTLLQTEEDRGRMLASLANSTNAANEMNRQRAQLAQQRDELHEERFDYVQRVLGQHDDRIANLEQATGEGERYSTTGITMLADTNRRAKASLFPPQAKPPTPSEIVAHVTRGGAMGAKWGYYLAVVAAAVATGIGVLIKMLTQ